ncbi:MAG: hypothetical protein AAFY46_12190, partial [Planctomycetota bacterium]
MSSERCFMSDDQPSPGGQFELVPPPGSVIAVSVGNTRAALGLIKGLDVSSHRSAASEDAK